jgi:hypothetical protein
MRCGPAWCWPNREGRAEVHAAELRVAPAVLAELPLAGRVVRGDALAAQRAVCPQLLEAGGDYLFLGKRTQPPL